MFFDLVNYDFLRDSDKWNSEFLIQSNQAINEHSSFYKMTKLEELFEERKEFLEPQLYPDRKFNYLGLENINPNTSELINFTPKQGGDIKSRLKVYRRGDILYGRLRPVLNKALIIDRTLNEGVCSTEIFVLKPRLDKVNPIFALNCLLSPLISDKVVHITAGASLPRVQIKDFLDLKVPLPPIEVQDKLAETLDFYRNEAKLLARESQQIFDNIGPNLKEALKDGCQIDSKEFEPNLSVEHTNPLPNGDFSVKPKKR